MSEVTQPVCTGVNIQTNRGGKIAIVDFGKISSGWGVSMSRSFAIPEDWTQEQIDAFQVEQYNNLAALIEPIDQAEYDVRYANREWSDE